MARFILGIHGLRNKPPEQLLRKWWGQAIQEGLERIGHPRLNIPLDMIYWADQMYPAPLDPKIKDLEHELYLDEHYQWNHAAKAEPRAHRGQSLRNFLEAQLHEIFLNPDLSPNYEKLTDRLFRHFFKDLDQYFSVEDAEEHNENSVRSRVQKKFLDILDRHPKDQVMLIAHSMGSIIAYDVMTQYPERCKQIDTLVTIGSPLGLSVIVGKLAQDISDPKRLAGKLRTPLILEGRWINYSDPEDKIAFDPKLSDDYAANDAGVGAEDIFVFNDYLWQDERNPHKSFGYLRCPELAGTVHEFLGEPGGRLKTWSNRIWSWIVIQLRRLRRAVNAK